MWNAAERLDLANTTPEAFLTGLIGAARNEPAVAIYERRDPVTRTLLDATVSMDVEYAEFDGTDPESFFTGLRNIGGGSGNGDHRRGDMWGVPEAFSFSSYETCLPFRPPYPRPTPSFPDALIGVPGSLVHVDGATEASWALMRTQATRSTAADRARRAVTEAAGNTDDGRTVETEGAAAQYLSRWRPDIDEDRFGVMVDRLKAELRNGRAAEVVASFALTSTVSVNPVDLYLEMRRTNPSPRMFLLVRGDEALVGASPMVLLRVASGRVEAETDGGTRRVRPGTSVDELDWTPNDKEVDEHTQVVDRLADDLAALTVARSVRESYRLKPRVFSHVAHLFAAMTGDLLPDLAPSDALRMLAPHGALVGHPRQAAAELIMEAEHSWRGPYGGFVATHGPDGYLDATPVLRSVWTSGSTATMRTGAGVVTNSKAADEYRECLDKALAAGRSLNMALRTQNEG